MPHDLTRRARSVCLLGHCRRLATMKPIWLGVLVALATSCCLHAPSVGAQDEIGVIDMPSSDPGFLQVAETLRAAAAKIEPSMVVVESFGGASVSPGRIGGLRGQGEGNTTGVIVSSDGWIVTSSFNFVRQPPVVTVVTSDGERRVADLVGQDLTRNLCLLRVRGVQDLPVPEFVPMEQTKIGQWVASVGFGYGDRAPALSIGIISAKGRASGRALQTDANTSPANYGGPLIDLDGRILGICVPLNPTAPGPAAGVEWYDSGIGFAIPIDLNSSWWERLQKGERLEFGFLGVNLVPLDPTGDTFGVKVQQVIEQGPAATAGILAEDQVLELDGVEIFDTAQFGVELRRRLAGDRVKLKVKRGEEQLELEVELGRSPNAAPEIPPPTAREIPIESEPSPTPTDEGDR